MGKLLLIVLITVPSILSKAVDELRSVHFAELEPQVQKIVIHINTDDDSYPHYKISKFELAFTVSDDSVDLIPMMAPHIYHRKFHLEYHDSSKQIIKKMDLDYINRKRHFYLKNKNLYFTVGETYKLVGMATKTLVEGKYGLQMRKYVETSTKQRDVYFFLNGYPYKFHHFVPNVSNKQMSKFRLAFYYEKGFQTLTSAEGIANSSFVFHHASPEEVSAVVIRNYQQVVFKGERELKVIAKGDVQNEFPEYLMPFANEMQMLFKDYDVFFNLNYPCASTKMIVLPGLNVQPMVHGRGVCIFDEDLILSQPEKYRQFGIHCFQHQFFGKNIKAYNIRLHFIERGIRGLYALIYLSNYEEKLQENMAKIIRTEEIPGRGIRLGDYKYDMSVHDDRLFGMKSVAFFSLLRSAAKDKIKFEAIIEEFMYSKGLDFTLDELVSDIAKAQSTFGFPDGFNVISIFETWNNFTGFPIVYIERRIGAIHLYTNMTVSDPKPFLVFPIKISVPSKEKEDIIWADSANFYVYEMDGSEEYYIINSEREVTMRVLYDEDNWKKLEKHFSELSPTCKGALVSDAYYFFKRGHLPLINFIRLIAKFGNETSAVAWAGIQYLVMDLERHFRFSHVAFQFHVFINHISEKFYDALEEHDCGFAITIACMAGNKKCLNYTRQKTIEFISSGGALTHREQTLCGGMREMDSDYYEYLLTGMDRKSKGQNLILMAMSCQETPEKIDLFIRWTLSQREDVISNDYKAKLMVHTFMASDYGATAFLNYFLYSPHVIYKTFKRRQFHKLAYMFSRYLKSKTHFRRMNDVLSIYNIEKGKILQNIIDNQRFIEKYDNMFTNELFIF